MRKDYYAVICSMLIIKFLFIITYLQAQDPSIQEITFVPNKININLKSEFENISVNSNNNGIALTGIPSLDSLNVRYCVIGMNRIFPGEVAPPSNSDMIDLSRYYYLVF